jgi:hypothetical protein
MLSFCFMPQFYPGSFGNTHETLARTDAPAGAGGHPQRGHFLRADGCDDDVQAAGPYPDR